MDLPPRQRALLTAALIPFAVVAAGGAFVLLGWWTHQIGWVQPAPGTAPLNANAALALVLLGCAPFARLIRQTRLSAALALAAALLCTLALLQNVTGSDLGLDDWLTNHRAVVEGGHIGRLPEALSALLAFTGLLLAWHGLRRPHPAQPVLLALAASLAFTYGVTALAATAIRLHAVDLWQFHAQVGPYGAWALLALAVGLFLLATFESIRPGQDAGLGWLWLPVVCSGSTITLLFWASLRERELAYQNSTTQLTINNLATLYSSETETLINGLNGMAAHWTDTAAGGEAVWERDIHTQFQNNRGLRSLCWVDAGYHTRWLWPRLGNEDALSYDHTSHPLRNSAMQSARESLGFAIAAPLVTPLNPPSLAIYAAVVREGRFDGFLVGEFTYPQILETIDRRLNISQRYFIRVQVWDALGAPAHALPAYQGLTSGERAEARLTQTASFNLFNQRLTIELAPRPEFLAPNRQSLPDLALVSGLGVSFLLGLVVNLAQAASTRQRAAERTTRQLRAENEERRRIEARLKVADERLNLALDSTQVGVYEWDVPTGGAIYSPSVWTCLGHDPARMAPVWQTLLDLMHPEDHPGFQHAVLAHFQGETPFIESEFRLRHASGEWHWFSTRAKCVSWDPRGHPRRVTGTSQDITERRRAEETLRTSLATTRKLSLVASRTDNAVAITRADGTVEWVNESFTRFAEQTLAEIIGRPFIELIASPDSDPHAVARVASALSRVEAITTDVLHHSPSGRHYYVHLEVQPLVNAAGQVENFIIIETDITSRVEVEQQLRRAKSEADAASRAKSDFLASMSHEIRTPMNGVIGMTSLLLDTPLTPEQRDFVSTIRTSGDALLSIINEILDFSKIESGKMELEHRPFELAQCVEEALDIFALQAAAKQIELAFAIDPRLPPWIMGDITRLRQVLVNLLNNAVKFTPKGFITVEVGPAPHPPTATGRLLIDFVVSDTGIGIPPNRLAALFKPFSQVDSSTTRKYGGTGLGLAICDRLCQLMGGAIDVTSKPGEGSQFRFSIQADPAENPAGLPPPPALSGVVVLAADDHRVNRDALAHAFTATGATLRLAASAEEAMTRARSGHLQLAVVDHDLAGQSGTELAVQLRTVHPNLPIILFTGAADSARDQASGDPYLARLPKPIKPSFLLETASRLVRGRVRESASEPAVVEATLGSRLPLRILLVEDNPVNQKVALRLLDRLGYKVEAVPNGLEAVRACLAQRYDLVFMDVQMPEMDGLTATREIRSRLAPEAQPKIVALTANAIQGDRERCLAAGMDDYLSKPVKMEGLESAILRFFTPASAP